MINRYLHHRWFPIVDLSLALLAGLLWLKGGAVLGGAALVLALLPWAMRAASQEPLFARTPLDWPMLLFLLTAVMGLWTAFQMEAAVEKFGIVLGAIFIFYALAGQSRRDVWLVSALFGFVGAAFSLYFLLTNNWGAQTADYFGPIRSVGLLVMRVRPSLPLPIFHPNIIAGILAVLLPFPLASLWYVWQKGNLKWTVLNGLAAAAMLVGLLMTGSISAWFALAAGFSIWLWWLLSGWLEKRLSRPQTAVFLSGLLLGGLVGIGAILLLLPQIASLSGSVAQRLDLGRQTLYLIDDFSITGSGLASFPALYSEYIRVVPFFFVLYSNLFLDVWLELSLLGLLALLLLIGISFWLLLTSRIPPAAAGDAAGQASKRNRKWSRRELYLFRWAAFISLFVLTLHGLTDDALFGGQGTPFLFVPMGMVVLVSRKESRYRRKLTFSRRKVIGVVTAVSLLLVFAFALRRPLLARWYANSGAAEMARIDLSIWPTNEWSASWSVFPYEGAVEKFNRALIYNPQNRTAHQRLGMIWMDAREFDKAVSHLEIAYQLSPEHRGIQKTLGYSYVWQGDYAGASAVLSNIPERLMEMQGYKQWWSAHQQPDLSAKAGQMAANLRQSVTPPPLPPTNH